MANTLTIDERMKRIMDLEGCTKIEEFLATFSPNYDPSKLWGHPQKQITLLNNYKIDVDEKLAELLTIINKTNINTYMSCQYNGRGYSSISFTSVGFEQFTQYLYRSAVKFCNGDGEKARDLEIVQRFISPGMYIKPPRHNQITYRSSIFDNRELSFSYTVIWTFYQEDIPEIVRQLKEIIC